jgi:hypothetical protein
MYIERFASADMVLGTDKVWEGETVDRAVPFAFILDVADDYETKSPMSGANAGGLTVMREGDLDTAACIVSVRRASPDDVCQNDTRLVVPLIRAGFVVGHNDTHAGLTCYFLTPMGQDELALLQEGQSVGALPVRVWGTCKDSDEAKDIFDSATRRLMEFSLPDEVNTDGAEGDVLADLNKIVSGEMKIT